MTCPVVNLDILKVYLPTVYSLSYLLPAAQGSVHSVDGILTDIEEHWIHKYIHIQSCVLGAANSCSQALKHTRD